MFWPVVAHVNCEPYTPLSPLLLPQRKATMPNSNHLAPTRETVEERARNAVRDLQERVPHPGADRTYRSEWKRYVGWVQQKRNERVVPDGNRFITREVVDLYFAQVVALRVVKPATARRAVSALQWQADKDDGAIWFQTVSTFFAQPKNRTKQNKHLCVFSSLSPIFTVIFRERKNAVLAAGAVRDPVHVVCGGRRRRADVGCHFACRTGIAATPRSHHSHGPGRNITWLALPTICSPFKRHDQLGKRVGAFGELQQLSERLNDALQFELERRAGTKQEKQQQQNQ